MIDGVFPLIVPPGIKTPITQGTQLLLLQRPPQRREDLAALWLRSKQVQVYLCAFRGLHFKRKEESQKRTIK
jgi:hypothetical protein